MKYRKEYYGLVIILPLMIFIRITIGEICTVPSSSMEPTILSGDRVWIDKTTYGSRLPQNWIEIPLINILFSLWSHRIVDMKSNWSYFRLPGVGEIKNNDIIVFNSPLERRILLVKRISKIYHTGDTLIINSKSFDRLKKVVEYEHKSIFSKNGKVFINGTADSTLRLQQSYYYVLGDNIQNSLDSRTFGYVPESSIVGKMSMILYSIDNKAPLKNRCRLSRTFMRIK